MSDLMLLLPTGGAPAFAVFSNPVQQRAFKPNVVPKSLGLEPFVF